MVDRGARRETLTWGVGRYLSYFAFSFVYGFGCGFVLASFLLSIYAIDS